MLENIKCFFINFKNIIRLKKHRVSIYRNLFKITDNENTIYIARINRHNRYKKGIVAGIDMLADQYSLNTINIEDNGLLIECGANVGELAIWAKKNSLSYIGFEPEKNEFDCVRLNAQTNSLVYRKALWDKNEKLTIYSLPNSGDSSAFDMGESTEQFEIDAVRLDNIVSLSGYTGTIILKIEAEGAEPEVLKGSKDILSQIDYVTIDCGPERGINQEYTFVEVNNIMVESGFKLLNLKFDRVISIYCNINKVR